MKRFILTLHYTPFICFGKWYNIPAYGVLTSLLDLMEELLMNRMDWSKENVLLSLKLAYQEEKTCLGTYHMPTKIIIT